jgi:hypothetical protein
MALFNKLEQLESELLSIDAPVLKYFKDGLLQDDIDLLFDKINTQPSVELKELYN